MNLKGKNILLGVTGGIAIYKSPGICSRLRKLGANTKVVMTENATKFVTPLTFMAMTDNHVYSHEFHTDFHEPIIEHIELAKWADIIVIAPASANIIAKFANGIGDDLLSSILLASRCPVMIVPAMNSYMLNAPATRRNIDTLQNQGVTVLGTQTDVLACLDVGDGKMLEPDEIVDHIDTQLREKDLEGMNIVVTAGPTQEAIDPVRFITNHSSGTMGYRLADEAKKRGAKVTLLSGPTSLNPPNVDIYEEFTTTEDLKALADKHFGDCDVYISPAAPADYRPRTYSDEKIKKESTDDLQIQMSPNPDVLKGLGMKKRPGQILVGFAAESHNELENAKRKLQAKNLDMIIVNNIVTSGFKSQDNKTLLITQDQVLDLENMDKRDLSNVILDKILELKDN